VLILGGNQLAGGYNVDNSIRYDKDASQYLRRTCGSSASSYTLSLWVKTCERPGGSTTAIYWNGTGAKLNWEHNDFSQIYWYDPETKTTGSYRDVSAWYHLVWKVSSNVGTMYINGVAAPGLTSVSSIDSLNSGNFIYIGSDNGSSPQNGYFAEVCFIDGTALDPTSFGEYDEDSGIWKPIDVSGLSFGSNGFYLDFEDSSALGNDVSGNNNDLTSAGFTSLNQTTDTPTNNYCTLNPLRSIGGNVGTYSEGNTIYTAAYNDWQGTVGTLGATSGKWYWEYKLLGGAYHINGIVSDIPSAYVATHDDAAVVGGYGGYIDNGQFHARFAGSDISGWDIASVGVSFTTNDILNVALDMDNKFLYFGKNGTWMKSGVPTSGATGTGGIDIGTPYDTAGLFAIPALSICFSAASGSINFGNPSFTISSGNSDGNGYGNFEYAVPSGYYSLNTKNLAQYG
jgi:hypothetical protein